MGKFLQVDPMADKYASATTYNYAFNNPVVMNDPSGADPDDEDDKTDDDGDKEEQDYQPGWSIFTSMWAFMDEADAMSDALMGVYSPTWNSMQYGSAAVGGSAFVRFGPGDGGALNAFMSFILSRAHGARVARTGSSDLLHQVWALLDENDSEGVTALIEQGHVSKWVGFRLDPGDGNQEEHEMKVRFGLSFVQKFVMSMPSMGTLSDVEAYEAMREKLHSTGGVRLFDDTNKGDSCTLQPVYYEIAMNNRSHAHNFVDGKYWTMPVYPNPVKLESNGTARPMSFTTHQGTIITWTVYFQLICGI